MSMKNSKHGRSMWWGNISSNMMWPCVYRIDSSRDPLIDYRTSGITIVTRTLISLTSRTKSLHRVATRAARILPCAVYIIDQAGHFSYLKLYFTQQQHKILTSACSDECRLWISSLKIFWKAWNYHNFGMLQRDERNNMEFALFYQGRFQLLHNTSGTVYQILPYGGWKLGLIPISVIFNKNARSYPCIQHPMRHRMGLISLR